MSEKYTNNNIITSTRLRIARNLENYMFLPKLSQENAIDIINDVKDILLNNEYTESMKFELFYAKDMNDIELNMLVEKQVVSTAFVKNKDISAYFINKDKNIIVMVNEEDHIKIEVINNNFDFKKCLSELNKIDDILEEKLNYAFDRQFGYLTTCPTNLGTAMRVVSTLHLPALSMIGQIDKVLLAISQIGVTVKSVYGEGTKSVGDLYQISNQVTLGVQEDSIIEKIRQITMQLVDKEMDTRNKLLTNNKVYIENEIFRSYGLLKYARMMSNLEAMKLLSKIKLGIDTNIIDNIKSVDIDRLILSIQENGIRRMLESNCNQKEINIKRAELVKNNIN